MMTVLKRRIANAAVQTLAEDGTKLCHCIAENSGINISPLEVKTHIDQLVADYVIRPWTDPASDPKDRPPQTPAPVQRLWYCRGAEWKKTEE
jgi:hypothetical protein